MFESQYCELPETVKRETLPYYEYYLGEKDEQDRRHGVGQNCWTGAESIEWHCGRFRRDTMHGPGEYRSRYKGKAGLFLTYEGRLYVNRMHGYGVMSYPDGKVFTGLFNNDIRYGPGVESFADVTANVGLWRSTKLVRLAWRPLPPVAPELAAWPGGRAIVDPHRVVMQTSFRTIDKVNKAVEFLKQHGSDPVSATENWARLYPKHCTDVESRLCHVELFDYEYYDGKVYSLKEQDSSECNDEDLEKESQNSLEYSGSYYAWNNDPVTIDMMKHCFKHEKQRKEMQIDLVAVLSGLRSQFQPPAMHELDCRTLLMACYLGQVATTTYLINERGVDPNVTDMLGNSTIMYATCGDQVTLITFLAEGGAVVNSANDSCCTPLGVALIRLLCASRDVPSNGMIQAFVPPPTAPASKSQKQTYEPPTVDWNITRETRAEPTKNTLGKVSSKITKMNMKNKSLTSVKDLPSPSKRNIDTLKPIDEDDLESKMYRDVNNEYMIKVTDSLEPIAQPVTYLFELNNMVDEINAEQAKLALPEKKDPKSKASHVLKEQSHSRTQGTKPSKEVIWQNSLKDEDASMASADIRKAEVCSRIKLTILTLLENGAKPSLVRCPQPALVMAILSGSPDLVDRLIHYGADVNEVYPQHLNYAPLDIAVSLPLNQTTLDLVQTLLMGGASADHRLSIAKPASPREEAGQIELGPGPTLLHYVLSRRVEIEAEEDIRRQIIHLLVEYDCDPLERYNGRSALDEATKSLDLLDVIIKNPKTNLNAAIDDSNQTILVKMFYIPYFKTVGNVERSQTLTNLLLFGADPLIECECEGVKYQNLFVLVKQTFEMSPSGGSKSKLTSPPKKLEAKSSLTKGKKPEPKKVDTLASDDIADLKQAVDLMTECSRIIYIRWLQTQLAKEIIQVIDRYEHRHWSMIIKECKNKKAAGLWITAQRCFEIWGRLKTTKNKVYQDKIVLWNLLCIAHFFHLRSVTEYGFNKVTAAEKHESESYANNILKDNKKSPMVPLLRYVQPELFVKADAKFNVCFECFLPLAEDRILCTSCKIVSFCNIDCLKESIEKSNGHACNDYLILKYFPKPLKTINDDEPVQNEPSVIK
ncbi:ankyrin repeat and MYND domain-containing protein 1-like [Cydia strobilella]|uniref:ankyrin repeat and MYND domain-containing protein 1-like n=1 Tax=Cydia strobilella TaxID=1100964 RepID=UPI003004032D